MVARMVGYIYTAVMAGLGIYAFYLLTLIILYLRHRNDTPPQAPNLAEDQLPIVTVQIPLRNEQYVANRIVDSVASLDWPADRLEVQILDDSDDETTQILEINAERWRAEGRNVYVIHREHPTGYKAGALAEGLKTARGEFVAIFDADFCPPQDFLRRTIPHLVGNPALGMLQTRWGHLNDEYSPITLALALALDAHFSVEHVARNRSGLLINFNGTAGIWRRTTIDEAGGWASDTVAEDLDLSLRAQIKGWKALFLPDVVAPAELPPLISAVKHQQRRWAKGTAQTIRKLIWPLLTTPNLTFIQKLMACFYLSGYFTQPLMLLLIFLTLPMVLYNPRLPELVAVLGAFSMIPPLSYLIGQITYHKDWYRRILYYPVLMLLGIGLAWSNTLALLDGMLHWGGPFVRTPKFQLQGRKGEWRKSTYRPQLDPSFLGEFFIGLYALVAVARALQLHQRNLIPFILIYVIGEGMMVLATLNQARRTPVRQQLEKRA